MPTIKYYPHIDGLRTIAVLAVLLYHLGIPALSGGFIGVDIFFVISGYLITGIIKKESEKGQFSFTRFYSRRIRRLLPAFTVMLLFMLVTGWFVLTPGELTEFSKTAIYAILSTSNIYFYLHNGYFDMAAESQLLLHTWSLAVEEQFYMIWPLLTILLVKHIAKAKQLILVCVVMVISILLTWYFSNLDSDMAFYLMPFRIGEFCLGAVLCWMAKPKESSTAIEFAVITSLSFLLLSLSLINTGVLFPGWVVVIPCALTSVLIHLGGVSQIGGRILSSSPMVALGKMSYSIYLFHWPVILFYKKITNPDLDIFDYSIIVASTILLAAVTTYFIESPLRKNRKIWPTGRGALAVFSTTALVCLVAFSHIWANKGYPDRFPDRIARISIETEEEKAYRFNVYQKICAERGWKKCNKIQPGEKNVFIIGDSHAIDALNILQPNFPNYYYVMKSAPGCIPQSPDRFIKHTKKTFAGYDKCLGILNELSNVSTYKDVEFLIISDHFLHFDPHLVESILKILPDKLKNHVLIFGNAPRFRENLPDILVRKQKAEFSDSMYQEYFDKRIMHYEPSIQQVAKKYGAAFLSKMNFYCPDRKCRMFYGPSDKLLTYDSHHLSFDAAKEFGKHLRKQFHSLDELFEKNR